MQMITTEWLNERLANDRGKRAALAVALGIGPDKVSKMLSGTRKPQANEVPTILAFFGESADGVDPELAEVWSQLEPSERMFLLNAAKAQIAARDQSR
jgi:DNA-binding transcriptional regulator YdaS (Cro superfamily)